MSRKRNNNKGDMSESIKEQENIRRSKEEVLESMRQTMPFHLSNNIKPYILEAMDIYAESHLSTKDKEIAQLQEENKAYDISLINNTKEIERLNKLYVSAVNGRKEFRSLYRESKEKPPLLIHLTISSTLLDTYNKLKEE
jgi:hypothetical protein